MQYFQRSPLNSFHANHSEEVPSDQILLGDSVEHKSTWIALKRTILKTCVQQKIGEPKWISNNTEYDQFCRLF